MAHILGRLDFGGPKVAFTVGGSKARLEFEGILDTGFTGFILLPISLAIPLGLELDGFNTSVTADGRIHQSPTATATVEFGDHSLEASIVLAYYGDEILIGMSFLELFQQSLIIHRDRVLVIDASDFDPALNALH